MRLKDLLIGNSMDFCLLFLIVLFFVSTVMAFTAV